jgi:hypothetical protein
LVEYEFAPQLRLRTPYCALYYSTVHHGRQVSAVPRTNLGACLSHTGAVVPRRPPTREISGGSIPIYHMKTLPTAQEPGRISTQQDLQMIQR